MSALEPWDRRPEETDEAWRAFAAYRDQKVPRSLRRLADELAYADHTMVGRWSSKHDWQERVRAWEIEQDRIRQETLRAENIEAAKRHARQMQQRLGIGDLLSAEIIRRIQADPEVLQQMSLDEVLDLFVKDARTAPRLLVAERLARGMTTESVEVTGQGAHAEKAKTLSDAELDAFLAGASAQADVEAERSSADAG